MTKTFMLLLVSSASFANLPSQIPEGTYRPRRATCSEPVTPNFETSGGRRFGAARFVFEADHFRLIFALGAVGLAPEGCELTYEGRYSLEQNFFVTKDLKASVTPACRISAPAPVYQQTEFEFLGSDLQMTSAVHGEGDICPVGTFESITYHPDWTMTL